MPDDVKLPVQVQKQQEEADRLWQEQHGKTDAAGNPIPAVAPESELIVEPEPEPEPIVGGESEPEPRVVEPELPAIPPVEPADIQHKFDVLQGKYDAEVPRLSAENKQLRDHSVELGQIIGTLQGEVEKLKTGQVTQEQPVVDTGQVVRQFLNEEEIEELQATIDPKLLGKIIDGVVKSQVQPLEQSVGSVRDTQFQTAEDVFWDKVNAIPDVSKINHDPGFNGWLDQKAPYTHRTRRQVLQEAQERLDAATVVELFNDFTSTAGAVIAQGAVPPSGATPPPPKRKPHISPARGAGGSSTPSAQGKIWTVKEINAFYQDVQKGKYKGKDKERNQKEQDIWNAQKEGRIRRT